jgi:hypothetical protein
LQRVRSYSDVGALGVRACHDKHERSTRYLNSAGTDQDRVSRPDHLELVLSCPLRAPDSIYSSLLSPQGRSYSYCGTLIHLLSNSSPELGSNLSRHGDVLILGSSTGPKLDYRGTGIHYREDRSTRITYKERVPVNSGQTGKLHLIPHTSWRAPSCNSNANRIEGKATAGTPLDAKYLRPKRLKLMQKLANVASVFPATYQQVHIERISSGGCFNHISLGVYVLRQSGADARYPARC